MDALPNFMMRVYGMFLGFHAFYDLDPSLLEVHERSKVQTIISWLNV